MTAVVSAFIGSNEYVLTSLATLLGWDGVGMVPVHRIIERGPLQNGDSDIGFRLDPRLINLFFGIQGSLISLDNQRALIESIFKPRTTAIKLRWYKDNGDVRQIDCHYSGDMTFPSKDGGPSHQKFAVTVRAADPLFYDPSLLAVTYGIGGGGTGGLIPLVVPMPVGATSINQSKVITYTGQFLEYPTVLITGPITDPVVTNVTTGDVLDFTGITIAAADTYTIDCRYGYKTVTNAAGTNKIADLTAASNLATFHLESDPDAPGGLNTIIVAGSAITGATEIYLQYYNRFLGV